MDQVWITLEELADRWRLGGSTPQARRVIAHRAAERFGLGTFEIGGKVLIQAEDVERVEASGSEVDEVQAGALCPYCGTVVLDGGTCFACRTERDRWLRGKYGITLDDYKRRLDAQGGRCEICGESPDRHRLFVDHDHRTGKVRGLLCQGCNMRIGWREKAEFVEADAAYLARHASE